MGVPPLHDAGLDDAQILRVGEITAYFNFVNHLALGLGVQVDDEDVTGYREGS
jgi:alkylhydroperoxidase family enzyme